MSTGEPPVLTVILPAHNAADHVADQLRALLGQSCRQPWELVVIDHRSNDGTGDLARRYLSGLDRARVIRMERGSNAAAARNTGAELASGTTLAFCDADDVVHPNWVQSMVDALAKHDLVVGRVEYDLLNERRYQRSGLQATPKMDYFFGSPSILTGNLGIRRWVWDALGGFDESMSSGEDSDFGIRASLDLGLDPYFESSAVVSVRQRNDTRSLWEQGRTRGMWQPALMKKHAHRLPRKPRRLKLAVARYARLLLSLRNLHNPGGRRELLYRAAVAYGRLVGSVRHRYFYL